MNKHKCREILKECLLSKQKRKNMHNQLKVDNKLAQVQENAKRVLIEKPEVQKTCITS